MNNLRKDNSNQPNAFLKYSGIGTQLLVTIAFGVWLGSKIDSYLQNKQPWGAIICSLLFMIAGLVLFIKSLPKP